MTAELRVGRYRLGERLGGGSFGQIFEGIHLDTGQRVAIKLEHCTAKHPMLAWEYKIYKNQEQSNTPHIYWFGREGEYNALIMEKLGDSLEKHVGSLNAANLKWIFIQMIQRIASIHKAGYIHRDIKPDNCLFGRGSRDHMLFIIDFGLSKRYIDEKGEHIRPGKGKPLIGTARYASINSHKGYETSRRDDMESIGYLMVYLAKGSLPWQNIRIDDKYTAIYAKKICTSTKSLCSGLPEHYLSFMDYVKKLKFEEEPDYASLIRLIEAS